MAEGGAPGRRVALCHEWLAARHGSEKTFEAMAAALPAARLHSLTWKRDSGLDFGGRRVSTTFLDHPLLRDRPRLWQLPLMPLAWRYASREQFDLVVTSSHACAKGFGPARKSLHLCYCYTPMRYAWLSSVDQRRGRRPGRVTSAGERWLRSWDLASVAWVDEFAAISTSVRQRVQELYGRASRVIHPPVDVDTFTPGPAVQAGGFALAVSRMVPYKRLDLAIRAAHLARHPLIVAGAGSEEGHLRALAAGLAADVRFVIEPTDAQLADLYRAADLVLFPPEEDFGIVPVEAQACGTPVVAYGRGGSLDTVVPGVTGVHVSDQDPDAFAAGMRTVLRGGLDPLACRRNAERFSATRFTDAFIDWVVDSGAARGIEVDDPRRYESV
ncbi:MAG: glycosyltransferase [Acidimicrobiales bacterium]